MCKRIERLTEKVEQYLKDHDGWCSNLDMAYTFRVTAREIGHCMMFIENSERMITPEYHGRIMYRYVHDKTT